MKRILISSLLLLCSLTTFAQSTFIPYNRDYYHLIDRFQIKYQDKEHMLQTTFKPIRRSDLAGFLSHVKTNYEGLSPQDQFNFRYLYNDNWTWTDSEYNENDKSWWDLMYVKKSDFYYYKSDNFTLRVNPAGYLSFGKDSEETNTLYTNTRGLEAIGMIDNKIGFYTYLSTTQARFPDYVNSFIRSRNAFPNEGFWKGVEDQERVYDFFHARGYFTFRLTQSIDVQAGYDKQFIGNGLRSMVLSDFSSPVLFLKLNSRLGPFTYTNLFAELTEDVFLSPGSANPIDGTYPKKFLATHRLGVQVTPNFEFGLFEMVIADSANVNYFNPLIFYRAIEQSQGSPDNVLLGFDFKWNIKNKYQAYGQFVLDEFLIDALRSGNGDWRNKYGLQLGLKYIDAFDIDNLDLQVEYNTARPYFYASERPALSYTNYRNPLAHPLGANFQEIMLVGRYQPVNKLSLTGKLIYSNQGLDDGVNNFGSNLLLSTDSRIGDLGNSIGQGVSAKTTFFQVTSSYRLLSNIFVDLDAIYRKVSSTENTSSTIGSLSLRWNLPRRQHEF